MADPNIGEIASTVRESVRRRLRGQMAQPHHTAEQRRKIAELEAQGLINQPKGRGGNGAAPRGQPGDLAALARSQPLRSRPLPVSFGTRPPALKRRRLLDELRKQGQVNVEGASLVSTGKAREILRHGTVHGRAISKKQRGLFGLIAGGGTPRRAAYR